MKSIFKWLLVGIPLFVFVAALYLYLSLPDVRVLKTKNPSSTALIEYRIKEAQRLNKNYRVKQYWVTFDAIPKRLKDTIRIAEDAAFYQHQGVDFTELKESIKINWEKGKYVRGGSTITQQLAKNLFLTPEKSIIRKVKEYFIAKRLEANLSKNRIFHLYLNIIEFGPGIFGVDAASQYYFHQNVSNLTLEEMVRLTAVIPKPLKENPTRNSRWLKWKTRWILNTLKQSRYIDQYEYQSVFNRLY